MLDLSSLIGLCGTPKRCHSVLALGPSKPRQNYCGYTTILLRNLNLSLRGLPVDGTLKYGVQYREEQDAHGDPSRTLVLNRDRNPPTFQNGPCIGHWHVHVGFSTFVSITVVLHSALPWQKHRFVWSTDYITVSFCIVSTYRMLHSIFRML
jgi:hypothetical protein